MTFTHLTRPPGSVPAVVDGDCFVSESWGFAYHVVPKTLSRAMLAYLRTVDPHGYRLREHNEGDRPLVAHPDLVRFTFVRNPYSRVVAVYYDKFVNFRDTQGQRDLFAAYPGLDPTMTFPDFVAWLGSPEADDVGLDSHFLPQCYFVFDTTGAPGVDLVGRVDDVDAALRELQDRLGLDRSPLAVANRNADRTHAFDTTNRWREVLDDHTIRLLTRRYDVDFAMLGFTPLPFKVAPRFERGHVPHDIAAAPRPNITTRMRMRNALKRLLRATGLEVRRARPQRRPSR